MGFKRIFVHLSFKNGSLVRQHSMEKNAGSWEKFSEFLRKTLPGNNGNIGNLILSQLHMIFMSPPEGFGRHVVFP